MASPIAQGRNAGTGQGSLALRERAQRTPAALQPFARRRVFRAGCALQGHAALALMRQYKRDAALMTAVTRAVRRMHRVMSWRRKPGPTRQ